MYTPDQSVMDALILVGGLSAIGLLTLFIVFFLIQLASEWQARGRHRRRNARRPSTTSSEITAQEYHFLRQLLEREIKDGAPAVAIVRRPADRQTCLRLQQKLDQHFGIEVPFNPEEAWNTVRQIWEKADKRP